MTMPSPRVIPALRITDEARSREYYVGRLGLAVEWEHRFGPGLPVFLSVARDGMRLHLTQHAGDCQPGVLVHFLINNVDAWHRESMSDDLGFRNTTVTDPDGNQLRFMTPPPRGRDTE